jgi:hypothetical protein
MGGCHFAEKPIAPVTSYLFSHLGNTFNIKLVGMSKTFWSDFFFKINKVINTLQWQL